MTVRDTTAAAERVRKLDVYKLDVPAARDVLLLAAFVLRAVPALERIAGGPSLTEAPDNRRAQRIARAVLSGDAGTEET